MFNSDGTLSETFQSEVAQFSAPTGMIMYSLTLNVGSGWLLADGSEVSRTTYANLFVQIGTRYGPGNGTTTFDLPDLRGRSPIGAGAGAGLTFRDINTINVGEENHLQTVAEMPAHVHGIESWSAGEDLGDGADILNQPDPAPPADHDTESAGGGVAFNVIHPCIIAYAFVKT